MSVANLEKPTECGLIQVGVLGAFEGTVSRLQKELDAYGIKVILFPTVRDYLAASEVARRQLQALLIHLPDFNDVDLDAIADIADIPDLPVLYNEYALDHCSNVRMRRLAHKLVNLAQPLRTVLTAGSPTVWVLAASFGGPEAVKRFFTSMPSVPHAMFLLAQHIGDGFIDLLASQLNRSTAFTVKAAATGTVLKPGHVYVAPVEHLVQVEPGDVLRLTPDTQRRHYRPCIDALMQEVARVYTARAGAVIFSGMGNDGARGAQAIAAAGGEVWAQSKTSCSVSSMPDCAAETGVVSRRGSPEELSTALVQYLSVQHKSHV